MQTVMKYLETLRGWCGKLGPYLLLEMVLPGGTLFAVLLFVYRRNKPDAGLRRVPLHLPLRFARVAPRV